mgnify:CR=1 FL=1
MAGIFKSWNIDNYKDIARQPVFKSLGFLLIFIMIFSAFISLKLTFNAKAGFSWANSLVNQKLESALSELPAIEIKNGILVLPIEPYTKKWEDDFALIIEPKTEDGVSILQNYNNCLLLTRKSFILKTTDAAQGTSKIQITKLEKFGYLKIRPIQSGLKISLANSKDFVLTPASVAKLLRMIQFFVWPVIFLGLFFWYSFTKLLQVCIFSLFSSIFNVILKAQLSYKALLNIGAYAIVPPTCLAAAKEIFSLKMAYFGVVYIIIYLTYLYLIIKSNKGEQSSQV